jgi:hypothetical protein
VDILYTGVPELQAINFSTFAFLGSTRRLSSALVVSFIWRASFGTPVYQIIFFNVQSGYENWIHFSTFAQKMESQEKMKWNCWQHWFILRNRQLLKIVEKSARNIEFDVAISLNIFFYL